VNNKICNLLTAIKEHINNKPIPVNEVKSATVMSPPASPVKIKSPSKLFKHLSPNGKEPVNPPGPIHFVNTITTISASASNSTQQQTNKFSRIVEDETSRVNHASERKPTDSPEQYTVQESGKPDEGKEKSEEHERNSTLLGKSIIEEPERKMEDVISVCSNQTKESNPKIFKIPCTIKEKLLTDSHIDPSLPVNMIPLSLYHKTFPERIACERVMKGLSIRVGELVYNTSITVVNDVDPLTNRTFTNLVLGKPFINESGVILDEINGSVMFTNGVKKVIFSGGNEEVYEYRPSLERNLFGFRNGESGKIRRRDPNNLKIPCMIGHKHFDNVHINVFMPKNVMSLFHYNNICRWGMIYKGEKVVGKDHEVQVFIGNMTFSVEFTIVDNIEDYIDPRLSQVVFGAPFCEVTSLIVDDLNGIMTFTDGVRRISYQTPYKRKDLKEIDRDGLDMMSSQLILCDEDVRRGCRNISDLSCGFFKDVSNLDKRYQFRRSEDPKYLHYESDTSLEDDLESGTNDEIT
jgi:hypothetical protein